MVPEIYDVRVIFIRGVEEPVALSFENECLEVVTRRLQPPRPQILDGDIMSSLHDHKCRPIRLVKVRGKGSSISISILKLKMRPESTAHLRATCAAYMSSVSESEPWATVS